MEAMTLGFRLSCGHIPDISPLMKQLCAALSIAILASMPLGAHEEDGFVTIFDGESFDGWKVSEENPGSFVIEDGAFVTRGEKAHLFYVGDLAPFRNSPSDSKAPCEW